MILYSNLLAPDCVIEYVMNARNRLIGRPQLDYTFDHNWTWEMLGSTVERRKICSSVVS